ncbi:peptidoglycan editing factor PgeF [Helicobacter sp. MIT 05-5293]|uniref:peptidoglycan editing factor PgeF n=1 Tax=Helicobacter sp. MIT 05-5293 TaxID=1548149 RepID=UPI00051DB312|nr:peptidoglycan editing factor PgeF [Helicobacter sp. MIT 05-5293]TLD81869.1 peptidoglycan editing factor PgeF [Helicobacter sp. MIT 05-5293]
MFVYQSSESLTFANQPVFFAVTDRFGGVSNKPFDTLNLAYHVNDDKTLVDINRKRVLQEISLCSQSRSPLASLYYLTQIHSNRSIVLDQMLAESLPHADSIHLGEADAIITALPQRLCMVMVADCNPILLYDTFHHILAVVHAGRLGVFEEIIPHTLEQMSALYHTQAKDILMYIGPSIRACCYEVGEDVKKEAFKKGFGAMINDTSRLDLIACLKQQYKQLGVADAQVEIDPRCSCCSPMLYSYRRESHTGRFALIAMLQQH